MDARMSRVRNYLAVSFAIACLFLCSCDTRVSNQKSNAIPLVSAEDLIQFNLQKLKAQGELLDSLAMQWGWSDSPGFQSLSSGLLLSPRGWKAMDVLMPNPLVAFSGDSVYWNIEVRLVDSTLVLDRDVMNPLVFHRVRSGWPAGFQQLTEHALPGDSVECLMPAHMAWGLTGSPPLVPQDAALLVRLRVLGDVDERASRADESNWMRVISEFEGGRFIPDSSWCNQPVLLGSPCLAWGDVKGQGVTEGPVSGTTVSLRMRTQVLRSEDEIEDLGWRAWQFEWGNEGQCLAVLEELMTADLRLNRWECWCPAEKAFGSQGFPEAGIQVGDVVGFQWELEQILTKEASISEPGNSLVSQ